MDKSEREMWEAAKRYAESPSEETAAALGAVLRERNPAPAASAPAPLTEEQLYAAAKKAGIGWLFETYSVSMPAFARAIESAVRASAPGPDALGYATRLAEAIWRKHYAQDAPDWVPLHDLLGVLTQIDNMTSGLCRASAPAPAALPQEPPYGFESGLVQILNEARCLSNRTVGNRELAGRIVAYMRASAPSAPATPPDTAHLIGLGDTASELPMPSAASPDVMRAALASTPPTAEGMKPVQG